MIYLFKPHARHASSYLLKSRATYLFPVMIKLGCTDTCLWFRGLKMRSPPMTSCSPCGARPFDVNLCRNRKTARGEQYHLRQPLSEESRFIYLYFVLFFFLKTFSPLISEQGTIFPFLSSSSSSVCLSRFSYHREKKKYSSPFSPVHPKKSLFPSLYAPTTYQPSYPISFSP